jgi:hypothetical protein
MPRRERRQAAPPAFVSVLGIDPDAAALESRDLVPIYTDQLAVEHDVPGQGDLEAVDAAHPIENTLVSMRYQIESPISIGII